MFGTDGTLLASAGEGSSYTGADAGVIRREYAAQALADGIIQQKEDVGAYRSQLVDSLGGKVIRIDPATGDGVASNPFYDPARPFGPFTGVGPGAAQSLSHDSPARNGQRKSSRRQTRRPLSGRRRLVRLGGIERD